MGSEGGHRGETLAASALGANAGLLLTMVFWGAQFPIVGELAARWDAYFLAGVRYWAAAPLFALLLAVMAPASASAKPARLGPLAALGSAVALFAIFYVYGVAHSHPLTAAVIAAAMPVVSAFVAWAVTGARPAWAVWLGLFLVTPGALIATIDFSADGARFTLKGGEPFILIAMICWSWYSLMAQRWLTGRGQLRITAETGIAAAPFLLIAYLIVEQLGWTYRMSDALAGDFWLFAVLILGVVVLGVLLWNNGVARLGLVVASMHLNLVPFFALLASSLWFGVEIRAEHVIGGLIVVAGVATSQILGARGARTPAA